jgi:hypothetical protein
VALRQKADSRLTARVSRPRLAESCVREMLSILVRYGAELGLPGCLEIHQVLGLMVRTVAEDIRRAWKAARPKKTGMRYEHAAAIVAEGLKRGTRRHRSVALGVAAIRTDNEPSRRNWRLGKARSRQGC